MLFFSHSTFAPYSLLVVGGGGWWWSLVGGGGGGVWWWLGRGGWWPGVGVRGDCVVRGVEGVKGRVDN